MTLTPEQIEQGWKPHDGTPTCPVPTPAKLQLQMASLPWIAITVEGCMDGIGWANVIAYREVQP